MVGSIVAGVRKVSDIVVNRWNLLLQIGDIKAETAQNNQHEMDILNLWFLISKLQIRTNILCKSE